MTPTASTESSATEKISPFSVDIPQEDLDDLRRRILATRWPTKELVDDRSQGVRLATIQALACHWASDYDWRTCESKLNALPQFKTEIDGVNVHFIHVQSPHEDALPLIMTHGWPGSVIELLESILRPARPLRTSRSRSVSQPFPARSGGPRGAGSRTPIRTSPTSTKPIGEAISLPGRSRSSSRRRSARPSGRCAEK